MGAASPDRPWTLLSGHGHVLVAIAKNPAARVRDLAAEAGLTERTTQAIIADLEAAGYITRRRVGRRAQYTVHTGRGFRHRSLDGLKVGPFLDLLAGRRADGAQDPHDADSDIGHGLRAAPDPVARGSSPAPGTPRATGRSPWRPATWTRRWPTGCGRSSPPV